MPSFLRGASGSMNTPRSARSFVPRGWSESNAEVEAMMVDLIISEIQTEICRIEQESEQRRQQALRDTKTPDYSWLMDWKVKGKKTLNFRECSEVELLCQKIKPNEWSNLINEWRSRVRTATARDEVLALFRTAVYHTVQQRCEQQNSLQQINEREDEPAVGRRAQSSLDQRSTSLAELSVRGLSFEKKYAETHEIV
ncbi:Protein C46A5.8 [Aphelenchoides avenae]|nr:Protein C46A5.8 [Aphelenchus avenae]